MVDSFHFSFLIQNGKNWYSDFLQGEINYTVQPWKWGSNKKKWRKSV